MTQQGLRQASIRAETGTKNTYDGDWLALFDQAGVPAGDFNGRLLQWINQKLSAAYVSLSQAQQALAVANNAFSFASMGVFDASNGPAYRPGIEAVGAKLRAAWDTQTTAGLTNPGALVVATSGNLPGSWYEDANFLYPPTGATTVSVADRLFQKPVYCSGAVTLEAANSKFAPAATNAPYAIAIEGGSSVTFRPTHCEFDLANCGKSFSSGVYQGGGSIYGSACIIRNAALNLHDLFGSAVYAEWLDSWFSAFGKKALGNVDPGLRDHCEPFHVRSGHLKLMRCLVDNRNNPIAANTVTATLAFPEGDGATPMLTLDGVVQVADGDMGGAFFVIQWGDAGGDSSISTVNARDSAMQPGAEGAYLAKGALGRLYGSNNYDLNGGALLSLPYDGPFP